MSIRRFFESTAKIPQRLFARWDVILPIVLGTVAASVVYVLVIGPMGRDVPSDPPTEENRVHHPLGFSMICPENWKSMSMGEMGRYDGSITLLPEGKRRYSGGMYVQLLKEPPENLNQLPTIEFQGKPARLRVSLSHDTGWEPPPRSSFELILERNGRWFSIVYGIFAELDAIPETVWPYLESFEAR